MEKIIIEIDEIELRNIEPNTFLDDDKDSKKFDFTAILKHKGIDQLIIHRIILTFETPEKFTWNDCWSTVKHGALGMNKELSNKISMAIVCMLRKYKKEIYPLSHCNNKVFTDKTGLNLASNEGT